MTRYCAGMLSAGSLTSCQGRADKPPGQGSQKGTGRSGGPRPASTPSDIGGKMLRGWSVGICPVMRFLYSRAVLRMGRHKILITVPFAFSSITKFQTFIIYRIVQQDRELIDQGCRCNHRHRPIFCKTRSASNPGGGPFAAFQYPRAGSTWLRSGRPSSKRRMLSRMIEAAVCGLVMPAMCGVTRMRGCCQNG